MKTSDVIALGGVVIAGVGLAGLVLSIRLLIDQLKIQNRQLCTQTHQAIYQEMQAIDLLMYDHLEIKAHVEQRLEVPVKTQSKKYRELMAYAELLVTLFEHAYEEFDGMSATARKSWEVFMLDYAQSPVIVKYCNDNQIWFVKSFLDYLLLTPPPEDLEVQAM